MEKMYHHAAGIDIGSRKVFVGLENSPVRWFETFTSDLEALKDYLLEHKVTSVAMEATGVYWYVLYDILLEAGLDVWLVDGRQTSNPAQHDSSFLINTPARLSVPLERNNYCKRLRLQ